jgi:hypothetical protein
MRLFVDRQGTFVLPTCLLSPGRLEMQLSMMADKKIAHGSGSRFICI